MPTNLRNLAKRLQTAIYLQTGRRVTISTYQVYSQRAQRTLTKYILSEHLEDETGGQVSPMSTGAQGKGRYKTLMQSWALPDVVKALAAILNGDNPLGDPAEHSTGDDT